MSFFFGHVRWQEPLGVIIPTTYQERALSRLRVDRISVAARWCLTAAESHFFTGRLLALFGKRLIAVLRRVAPIVSARTALRRRGTWCWIAPRERAALLVYIFIAQLWRPSGWPPPRRLNRPLKIGPSPFHIAPQFWMSQFHRESRQAFFNGVHSKCAWERKSLKGESSAMTKKRIGTRLTQVCESTHTAVMGKGRETRAELEVNCPICDCRL